MISSLLAVLVSNREEEAEALLVQGRLMTFLDRVLVIRGQQVGGGVGLYLEEREGALWISMALALSLAPFSHGVTRTRRQLRRSFSASGAVIHRLLHCLSPLRFQYLGNALFSGADLCPI